MLRYAYGDRKKNLSQIGLRIYLSQMAQIFGWRTGVSCNKRNERYRLAR